MQIDSFYKSKQFIIGALIVLSAAVPVNNRFFGKVRGGEDIRFIFNDSETIANGGNPYLRTLDGNMKDNDKYATYFPLFYELGAASIKLGLKEYRNWLMFWQVIISIFLVGCGLLIFHMLRKWTDLTVAIFAVLFFFFHRWIINVSLISQIDFIAIFFLLLSLLQLDKNFKKALLWFGLSLAIKQIGIFMAPLYLVWAWHRMPNWRYLVQTTMRVAIIPLIVSAPFIIWNFKAFLYSVFFSATRRPAASFDAKSIDAMVGTGGLIAKLPMIALIGFTCYLALKNKIGVFTSAFFVMAIFVGYNSVFFKQYFAWTLALLPLVIIDTYRIWQPKSQDSRIQPK